MSKKNRKAEKKLIKAVLDWYNVYDLMSSDAVLLDAVELYADTVNSEIEGEEKGFDEEDYFVADKPNPYSWWYSLQDGLKDAAEGRVGNYPEKLEAAVESGKEVVEEVATTLLSFFKF